MRRPGGCAFITDPNAPLREIETYTCAHCNGIVHVEAKARPEDIGGLCKVCMGLTCPRCTGHACTPFEKRLEAMEAAGRTRRHYEEALR